MPSIFGTDGVRGIANKDLSPELALKLGIAGGRYLLKNCSSKENKVLIGRDTRVSGDMLEAALVAGLNSAGLDVDLVGIIPTPGVAYLVSNGEYCGGVMISASHNPIEDNGIKFFNREGYKLSDEQEEEIEEYIQDIKELERPGGAEVGRCNRASELKEEYLDFLYHRSEVSFEGFKVVLDTAFGAAWELAPELWEKLGAQVISLHDSPDGTRINHECGSTHPERLQKKVSETGASMGFAFDGDADRVIAVDEKGNLLDGDYIMAICGTYLLKQGQLPGNTVVATNYSNQGLAEALQNSGGDLFLTKNGDRYVLEALRNNDWILGGEQSGHIIFLQDNATGDGILTSLKLGNVVAKEGKTLSEMAGVMNSWPQLLENVRVKSKDWKENNSIKEVIKEAEKELKDRGRIFVRASGTEPVIRVMIESKEEKILPGLMDKVVRAIDNELN